MMALRTFSGISETFNIAPNSRSDRTCTLNRSCNVKEAFAALQKSSFESHQRFCINVTAKAISQDDLEQTAVPPMGLSNSLAENAVSKSRVTTIFRWPAALEGTDVSVIGSFNGWRKPINLRRSKEDSDFVRSIALPPGEYQYRFKVDGDWETSPCESIVADRKGRFNNQRIVAESAKFHWLSEWGGEEVFVTGDFTSWTELVPLDQQENGFSVGCSLAPGSHSYQFLVDGRWMTSPEAPVAPDELGHLCNKMFVEALPAFRLCYATGWQDPELHARELGSSGEQSAQWQSIPMSRSSSRAGPQGSSWFTATVPASIPAGRLEFHISSGQAEEGSDRPSSGTDYVCPVRGGYKLVSGQLTPFSRACQAAMMLVSDLDGTMVGETPAADAATQEFCDYWENNAVLAGSVLVYNTGRSLGQFVSLLEQKAGALAVPDVLITAVGTKIFLLGEQAEGRGSAQSSSWREDLQWAKRLDHGWDLIKVREVAGEVVNRLAAEDAGHWLDAGTEHPHRIALSIRADHVAASVRQLGLGFQDSSLEVQIIVSGVGGWRYIDCVSIKGGKLKALQYVSTLFGIPRERCIAAGDSGNDVLMLAGENKAVVVGNAQPELVDWLIQQPQNDRLIYSGAHLARGVLEGIARHGLY